MSDVTKAPRSTTPISGRWVQHKVIGGWKPSNNVPHQSKRERERRLKRMAKGAKS